MLALRQARKFRGYSQYDLEAHSNVHQSRISLAENGYLRLRDDEKQAIAHALEMTVDLIEWPERNALMEAAGNL